MSFPTTGESNLVWIGDAGGSHTLHSLAYAGGGGNLMTSISVFLFSGLTRAMAIRTWQPVCLTMASLQNHPLDYRVGLYTSAGAVYDTSGIQYYAGSTKIYLGG